jgi:hypothetical protein
MGILKIALSISLLCTGTVALRRPRTLHPQDSRTSVSTLCCVLCAGTVTLPEGVEMVLPGDNVTCTFELLHPVAMEQGLRFAIREGGRTVGAGVVSQIIE